MSLATTLRLNALSCLIIGALFLARAEPVSAFLGDPPALLLRVLGAGLVLHGVHLGWAARRRPRRWEVRYFSLADAVWVLATLILVVSGTWITTAGGTAAAAAVAVLVGGLGWLQWRHDAPEARA